MQTIIEIFLFIDDNNMITVCRGVNDAANLSLQDSLGPSLTFKVSQEPYSMGSEVYVCWANRCYSTTDLIQNRFYFGRKSTKTYIHENMLLTSSLTGFISSSSFVKIDN